VLVFRCLALFFPSGVSLDFSRKQKRQGKRREHRTCCGGQVCDIVFCSRNGSAGRHWC